MPRKSIDILAGTTFYFRMLAIACAICGGTWCFGLAGMMWQHPDIFTIQPWYELTLGICICAACAYGYLLSDHRICVFILAPVAAYLIMDMIYNPYIMDLRAFNAWEFFAIIQTIYGSVMLAGAGVLLVHLIALSVNRYRSTRIAPFTRGRDVARQHLLKFKRLHIGLLIAIIGSGVLSQAIRNNYFIPQNASVTLYPGNYTAKFQFYGPSNYSWYTQAERDDLNALGVRIITGVTEFVTYHEYTSEPYTWWMNLTNYEQTADYQSKRQQIINVFTPWKENDINVTFLYWLEGIPSGLPTDYSVTTGYWGVGATLLNAWLAAEVIVEANLTNVVGFHTDQESVSSNEQPVGGALNQTFQDQRSFDRSTQATDNYLAFFQRLQYEEETNATWIAFDDAMNQSYGVDHLMFTTTYASPSVEAGLGGTGALASIDVFTEDIVNTVPYDEFLPMLYFEGTFPPDLAQYNLYMQMQELKTTLAVDGFPNPAGRIGVLLGCMGSKGSLFLPGYTGYQYMNGEEQKVTGFDVVARQVLIAKCFNCTWVSFFPLNPYPPDIDGIYATFGDTFFDALNATVNGPTASTPFQIRYFPRAGDHDIDFARILFMSDAWAWFYLAGLIVVIAVPCVHRLVNKRRLAAPSMD